MAVEQTHSKKRYELPLQELRAIAPDILWHNPPIITQHLPPTTVCQLLGDWYATYNNEAHRRGAGQFFTSPIIAQYMVSIAGSFSNDICVLDPGAGVCMLSAAVCEAALQQGLSSISIIAYESDPILARLCQFALQYAHDFLQEQGTLLSFEVYQSDFVEAMAEKHTVPSLWQDHTHPKYHFDLAILNPPYFKVNQQDPRTKRVKDIAEGRTNMYTMFMSLAAASLRIGGQFISITPRSFASGSYFKHFRRQFFRTISLDHIHIFDSRRSAFEADDVLQENIILHGYKKNGPPVNFPSISLSRSHGTDDLLDSFTQQVEHQLILDENQEDLLLHLPIGDIDIHLLQAFKHWKNTLKTYELEISTGPVVPFRASQALTSSELVEQGKAVPLLWLQHVHRMQVSWPLTKLHKPQALLLQEEAKLLVSNSTQIILRRFSTKEEARRITAAVLYEKMFGTEWIGLENHLNYLYRSSRAFSHAEAIGLAAFLNSSIVDRYFRITSGNTQVNATELRTLPLPTWEHIIHIGEQVIQKHTEQDSLETEHIIMQELREDLRIGSEEDLQLPALTDSRLSMGKIQEAQRILRELGLPPAQQNEISALTLLALCKLDEDTVWVQTTQESLTIHNILLFMKHHYGRVYAENTREVVRRQVIHQLEQARLVDRNPDNPHRETNSPNTCYALTNEAHALLAQYGTSTWGQALKQFLTQHGALQEKYQRTREAVSLPLRLVDGTQLLLSPGKHNELQIAIIQFFGPHFVPGATVLYLGDAAKKHIIYEQSRLEQLRVPITQHDKLPDIILFDEVRNRLYLIEAVTSHGPVSHKRLHELETLLAKSSAKRVYISAFLTYHDYRKYDQQIAWDTDVWIAEISEHMIHRNGDKFVSVHE